MNKTNSILWFSLLILIFLPSPAGRFLIDLAGGIMIGLVSLSLIFAGIGWLGWRIIQSKISTCENCGISTFNNPNQCPMCGFQKTNVNKNEENSIPASEATIDINFEETNEDD